VQSRYANITCDYNNFGTLNIAEYIHTKETTVASITGEDLGLEL
jgi:hypothetical protein